MQAEGRTILFIDAHPSGTEGSFHGLRDLITASASQFTKAVVVLLNDSPLVKEYEALGASVYRLSHPVFSRHAGSRWQRYYRFLNQLTYWLPFPGLMLEKMLHRRMIYALRKIVRKQGVTCLHLNNQPMINFFGFILARKTRLPVICHLRTLHVDGFTPAHARYLRKVRARYIAVTQVVKYCWQAQGIPSDLIQVIGDPIAEQQQLAPQAEKQQGEFKIVYVGRLEKYKGLDFLLQGFAKAADKIADCSLHLIGVGPYRQWVESLMIELDLNDKVHFYGYIDNVIECLPQFDALVLPSKNDGFGRVILEAMAADIPVIATRGGGIPELVQHDVTGLLIDYDDVSALRNAIIKLRHSPKQVVAMVSRAKKFLYDHFSMANFSQQIQAIYSDLTQDEDV